MMPDPGIGYRESREDLLIFLAEDQVQCTYPLGGGGGGGGEVLNASLQST